MDNFYFKIPKYVNFTLERLRSKGFVSYIVGGCVRDLLLSKHPYDWDICTNATPQQMQEVFSDCKLVLTGIKHGTVTLVRDNNNIEITTFRKDGDYSDHRRPDKVNFTTELTEDLSRRDFTVNAMAYHPKEGLIDKFGGIDDLNNKIIRCVGDAGTRFNEDALRMLRALRFSSTLGFDIEKHTAKAIISQKALITFVSKERVNSEFSKLICGDNVLSVLSEFKDFLFTIIPQMKDTAECTQENPYHVYDVFSHSLHALSNTPPDLSLRLSALLHDIGKPFCKTMDENGTAHFLGHAEKSVELATNILNDLRYANNIKKDVLCLIAEHDHPFSKKRNKIKRKLNLFGEDFLFKLIKLKRADILSQNPNFASTRLEELEDTKKVIFEILESGECFKTNQLKISGDDLLDLGFKGKELGEVLKKILELVINGQLKNERITLVKFAKKQLKN